jgi:hypothetical protein
LNALGKDELNHILKTDEANFLLCGNINSENCRYWTTENPHNIHHKPLHSQKDIVWCGVAFFGVIGPYSFEDKAGKAVTVNSAHYTEMICTFLELESQRLGVENHSLVLARWGNTSHCKDCNASPQRDVRSSHDLTKSEY